MITVAGGCGLVWKGCGLDKDCFHKMSSSSSTFRSYTLSEVASHNTAQSLWLVIEDKVYDVTAFKADVS